MNLPWYWITGTIVTAIGAIAIGLASPRATTRVESATQGSRPAMIEIDPWEAFIRTDGKRITEQIEQMGMEIDNLKESLTQIRNRVSPTVLNSPEMREWKMKLELMETEKIQLEDRRHRVYLRWNLWRISPQIQTDSPDVYHGEAENKMEFPLFDDSTTDADEPETGRSTLELFIPSPERLGEIQNEVLHQQQIDQNHFQNLFGQTLNQSQIDRYSYIFRHFRSKGILKQRILFTLTTYYSVYIISGKRFSVNQGMALDVRRHGKPPPAANALKSFQLEINKKTEVEAAFFAEKYDMQVTRYPKMRLTRVFTFSRNAGASIDQAYAIVKDLKGFINNGALPQTTN
jgi:hypothetical protein